MANTRVSESFINRRSLIWMAWGLLAMSVLMPAPAGSFANDAFGISAFYVLGKAVMWSEALPGSGASLGFLRGALVALAAFSNIAFVCASFLRDQRDASITWKGFLLVALALDAIVAFVIPEVAHLPAYWVWLASIAVLAFAFLGFPGRGTAPASASRKGQTPTDDRGVPAFVWVLLAFTLLWIAVSAGNYARPAGETDTTRDDAPLTRYVTDNANVLTRDETTQLVAALDVFEKATSNQVAVAIYRRVPDVSVEAFTIGVAERSRLGRKGLDNGAILFIFVEQRIARLEVGYGLEGVLTDVESHRILEADLGPRAGPRRLFRRHRHDAGRRAGAGEGCVCARPRAKCAVGVVAPGAGRSPETAAQREADAEPARPGRKGGHHLVRLALHPCAVVGIDAMDRACRQHRARRRQSAGGATFFDRYGKCRSRPGMGFRQSAGLGAGRDCIDARRRGHCGRRRLRRGGGADSLVGRCRRCAP